MRIGIYGGTFNPPHIGHIHAAKQAIAYLKLDKLLIVPDHVAPHKQIPDGSPTPQQRLQMLHLAVGADEKIEVSDLELQRDGPSYSYITVEAVRDAYPDAKLYFLMGTDMFLSFQTWKEPQRIAAAAALAVMYRGEKQEREKIDAQRTRLQAQGVEVELVKNEAIPISSTQLRRLLAFACADDFLSADVARFIRENGLYDTAANWKNLPMEQLEPIVIRLLNPNRVAHVLGCRDTAVALAKRWGADVTDAARAGILHDITKALDGPLQLTLCGAYGKILSDFSRKYPKTLHALTGSMVAQRIFGENERVVEAICSHTTGKANMNLLEKIIYVADYMEPCRNFPGVEQLRELAFSDLDAALRLGLEMTLTHLRELGDEVSPESREALVFLKNCS